MSEANPVLITGAAGNLGGKLRRHLEGRYPLRLLDLDPGSDPEIRAADFSRWDAGWVEQFHGVDTVVHLAADATAQLSWPKVVEPNIDAVIHVYQAAQLGKVRRVVYASLEPCHGRLQGRARASPPHDRRAAVAGRPLRRQWRGT